MLNLLSLTCSTSSWKLLQSLVYPASPSATSTRTCIWSTWNSSLFWLWVLWTNSFGPGSWTLTYAPMPLRVLEESAKPQAHGCSSSPLNFIHSLAHFFSLTLNSLMEISWHYSKAFTSWAERSRQKPKTATPQESEQSKGF